MTRAQLSTAATPREIRDTYDRLSWVYDLVVGPLEGSVRRRSLERLDPAPGERVLDVGCGPGHALAAIGRAVGTTGFACGLDAAGEMLERARTRCARRGADATAVQGDARRLPFREDAFDAVYLASTLELFPAPDIERVLREVRRVLTAGGRLCLVTMDRGEQRHRRFVSLYEWVYRHVPGYDAVGCRPIYAHEALKDAGFAVQSAESLTAAGVWPLDVLLARPV